MRFLLDECCPRAFATALHAAGVDIVRSVEVVPGATDRVLAELAATQDRVVVTQDYDFAEMAVRRRVHFPGVLLVACPDLHPDERAQRLVEGLGQPETLLGRLTIIEPRRIRQRVLSPGP